MTPDDKVSHLEAEVLRYRDRAKALQSRLDAIVRSNLSAEEVREKIIGISAEPVKVPTWVEAPPKSSPSFIGRFVTVWSDWHVGEVVEGPEVSFCNKYNSNIFIKRLSRLAERTIDLCTQHMVGDRDDGIILCLGGDLVSGGIHDELMDTDDLTPQQAVLLCRDHLVLAITRLVRNLGKVWIPCVSGNHGRSTPKNRSKNFSYHNYDWLIYSLLERHFQNDDRVAFFNPAGNEVHFSVYGCRYLLLHGHDLGVGGGDGIIGAAGPILRGRHKIGRQQSRLGREFDTMIIGHFHQTMWLPGVFVNNCMIGPNEYGTRTIRAIPSNPSQIMWAVHPKHGETFKMEVFVNDPGDPRVGRKFTDGQPEFAVT